MVVEVDQELLKGIDDYDPIDYYAGRRDSLPLLLRVLSRIVWMLRAIAVHVQSGMRRWRSIGTKVVVAMFVFESKRVRETGTGGTCQPK